MCNYIYKKGTVCTILVYGLTYSITLIYPLASMCLHFLLLHHSVQPPGPVIESSKSISQSSHRVMHYPWSHCVSFQTWLLATKALNTAVSHMYLLKHGQETPRDGITPPCLIARTLIRHSQLIQTPSRALSLPCCSRSEISYTAMEEIVAHLRAHSCGGGDKQ